MEKQRCPYCGAEMQRGWLRSRRSDIWWEPDPTIPAPDAEQGMRCIAAAGSFTGAEAEAWDCPACKKLILDRSRRNLPLDLISAQPPRTRRGGCVCAVI